MDNIVFKSSFITNIESCAVVGEPFRGITAEHIYMCTTDKYTITDGEEIYYGQFIVNFTVETLFGEIMFKSFTSKCKWRKNPTDLGNSPLRIVFKRLSNAAKTVQIYSIAESNRRNEK